MIDENEIELMRDEVRDDLDEEIHDSVEVTGIEGDRFGEWTLGVDVDWTDAALLQAGALLTLEVLLDGEEDTSGDDERVDIREWDQFDTDVCPDSCVAAYESTDWGLVIDIAEGDDGIFEVWWYDSGDEVPLAGDEYGDKDGRVLATANTFDSVIREANRALERGDFE